MAIRTKGTTESLMPVGLARYRAAMIEELTGQGKVVGGQYINGTVTTGLKGDLVIQAGFKRRKLNATEVAEWDEVTAERGGGAGAVGAVGKVVAGAVLPGIVGKMAGAAIDATLGSAAVQPRVIRVDWNDGKQSLIRLPSKLFTHLTVVLNDRRVNVPAAPESTPGTDTIVAAHAPQADVVEQIGKLALLRDQGALSEEEFATKKAELLARL
jgi:hypothetical protein